MSGDYSIGIDLGGTSIRFGLMSSAGLLLHRSSVPTRVAAGPRAVVAEMAACVEQMRAFVPAGGALHGIGIGSPGPSNLRDGVLGQLPNFPGWDGFPLRDALCAATGMPVLLESDANAAALAEWRFGAHGVEDGAALPAVRSMCMITLGTGVGSGFVLEGAVWHGILGMGGEVGHCSIDPRGEVCACGNRGCLELYASATGIVRAARRAGILDESVLTTEALAVLAEKGDGAAREIFARVGEALGLALTTLVNTLDLELYVIGGGVAQAWELFAPAMLRALRERSVVYRLSEPGQQQRRERDRPFIAPASLGPDSGLLGAALLPLLQLPGECGFPLASGGAVVAGQVAQG